MQSAAKEALQVEIEEKDDTTDETRDITVALDGSWQKRGHTSQNGIVTAIRVSTGKVLDAQILSKYCRCLKRFEKVHHANCVANYMGSSGGMEVAGAVDIFRRSEKLHNVRYKKYLSDGDTSYFSTVAQLKPYGPDCVIDKLECVGHVQKRMSTRLIKIKTKKGRQELSNGNRRLPAVAIKQIAIYYGLAIRRNPGNLQKMLEAVWTVYCTCGPVTKNLNIVFAQYKKVQVSKSQRNE